MHKNIGKEESVKLPLLSRGRFTKCFKSVTRKNTVVLLSTDYAKESFSMSWVTPNQLFPKIESVETLDTNETVYLMKEYKTGNASKIGQLNKKNLKLYYELKKLDGMSGLDTLRKEALSISDNDFREMFLGGLDALSNWGTDMVFDFRRSNIAIEKGKLILVDPFYFKHQAMKLGR